MGTFASTTKPQWGGAYVVQSPALPGEMLDIVGSFTDDMTRERMRRTGTPGRVVRHPAHVKIKEYLSDPNKLVKDLWDNDTPDNRMYYDYVVKYYQEGRHTPRGFFYCSYMVQVTFDEIFRRYHASDNIAKFKEDSLGLILFMVETLDTYCDILRQMLEDYLEDALLERYGFDQVNIWILYYYFKDVLDYFESIRYGRKIPMGYYDPYDPYSVNRYEPAHLREIIENIIAMK